MKKDKQKVEVTEEPIVNEEKTQVEVEVVDYKDKYLRLLADMDNMRKNSAKQISTAYTMANEKLIKEMLPYMDALDLAVNNAKEDVGYTHLRKQLMDILARFGVKQLDINEGDKFDESTMNAIMLHPIDNSDLNNRVSVVTKKGYSLNDNIIRYADVVVYASSAA